MPIEVGIWKINAKPEKVHFTSLDREIRLESILDADISILDPDLMVVGRQVNTDFGNTIDLIAINSKGDLSVIELKRNKTPRDVVAQTLDYASWVLNLNYEDVITIFTLRDPNLKFEKAFSDHFGIAPPESINENHQLIIVASELDSSTERIISYLSSQYGVPINAVYFRYFRQGQDEFLARTWLIDPNKVEASASKSTAKKGGKETWNGRDFYVAVEEGVHRTWDDCVKFGFVSAGQGRRYSRTLEALFPGARIFVHIPGKGYVGVGTVKETVVPVKDFIVNVDGQDKNILEVPLKAPKMGENAENPEMSEHLVRVEWLKARDVSKAIWETGMFANQNCACRLRNKFTLDTLTERFGLEE